MRLEILIPSNYSNQIWSKKLHVLIAHAMHGSGQITIIPIPLLNQHLGWINPKANIPIFRSWSLSSVAALFLDGDALYIMYYQRYIIDCISAISCWIVCHIYLLFFSIDKSPHRCWRPTPLDLALPTTDRCDALQSHGPHGMVFCWREIDVENFRSFTIESKGFKPIKVYFEVCIKFHHLDGEAVKHVYFFNQPRGYRVGRPHPPSWWSNNLLSMVPCVVLCRWWWLEPRSNVAVPPLRHRWHMSDSAAIFDDVPRWIRLRTRSHE